MKLKGLDGNNVILGNRNWNTTVSITMKKLLIHSQIATLKRNCMVYGGKMLASSH